MGTTINTMRNRQRSLTAADAFNYGFGHLLRQEAQDEQVRVPSPQKVEIRLTRGSDRCCSAPGFRRSNETTAQKLHRENNTGTYDNIGLVPPFARDTDHRDQAFFKMMKLSNETLSKYTSQYVPDHRKMLKKAAVQVCPSHLSPCAVQSVVSEFCTPRLSDTKGF